MSKYIFSQVVDFIYRYEFDKCVKRYNGDYHVRELTCYNQFLHLLFGQLTACESLRDICLCLKAHKKSLFQLGFRQTVNESSLSRANERRDYRIYEDLGYYLIRLVRPLYSKAPIENVDLPEYEIFALDSTTISCSINLLTWALGKYSRGAVKMHVLLDLRGSIPAFIHITDGKWHDSNVLDVMDFYPNEIYVMDKAYVDFEALFRIDQTGAFFVTRAKGNLKYEVVETNGNINEETGLRGDHTICLTGLITKSLYPKPLRLVKACDEESGEVIDFISNNMEIDALDIANLYRNRWNIEVFNKWIKQNLVIKKLWGYSSNAVKTHLWVAICSYLLVALIKARLNSPYSITEVATLISVSALEKADLKELLTAPSDLLESNQNVKEPELFE